MEALASSLFAAITAMTGTLGSPEITLFVAGIVVGVLSAPFSYGGRRALARIQVLEPEIQRLKAKHGDDRQALQRSLLELYRRQSINPWSPLWGLIPAVIEIALIVVLYAAIGAPDAWLAPVHLRWLPDLSSRDPWFVLAGSTGLLFAVQARGNIRANPPRENRIKLFLHVAVPATKAVIAAALPSGVVIAWLAYSAVALITQHLVSAAA